MSEMVSAQFRNFKDLQDKCQKEADKHYEGNISMVLRKAIRVYFELQEKKICHP